ncbi:hypothetical protein EXIGLDRAFT_728331 [Exidia glandulosa HHB12029]|uniref:Uncharacterized protein n=1 Tax=Exidia glandulosa HHB12029 TaxID=1314781 RepID=A0A166B6K8_EXIGL|nr:hypothetical protein EXIGLDRAFT_728331 [Exidia glandulosa HHB12029]
MRRRHAARAPQRSSAARLPPELLLSIFSQLQQPNVPQIDHDVVAAHDFVSTVAAVPLVCAGWREAGYEALYRFVDLTFKDERSCTRFVKSLVKNPRLGSLVHGVALPRYDMPVYGRPSTHRGLVGWIGGGGGPTMDADRVHSEIIARCKPLEQIHFPADHTTRDIVDSGALISLHSARVGFSSPTASTPNVCRIPVVPHLRHVTSLAIALNDPADASRVYFLMGTENLVPPRLSSLSTLHLANLVMPVAQWTSLLSSLRNSLKQLIVHSFMLALSQGDGRDLLLPEDLLPVAGTLEHLEVGTVLRSPGALQVMPRLRQLSAFVAFPTVLPPPRSLPRVLQYFRIVDDRRGGTASWAWPIARFVHALLHDVERPLNLERLEIETVVTDWTQLRLWHIIAFCLHEMCSAADVVLSIDLRGA